MCRHGPRPGTPPPPPQALDSCPLLSSCGGMQFTKSMPRHSEGRLASGRDLSPPSRRPVGSSASRLTGPPTQGLGMPSPSGQAQGHWARSRLPVPLLAAGLGRGVLPACVCPQQRAQPPGLQPSPEPYLPVGTVSPALGSDGRGEGPGRG